MGHTRTLKKALLLVVAASLAFMPLTSAVASELLPIDPEEVLREKGYPTETGDVPVVVEN